MDMRTGVSGDMVLGALIDLAGVPFGDMKAVLEEAGSVMGRTAVRIERLDRSGTPAVSVRADHGEFSRVSGARMLGHIEDACDVVGLDAAARKFAVEAVGHLIDAEREVHGVEIDQLHLHETGSPDTIVDVVGTAYLVDMLGLRRECVLGTRIALGGGSVMTGHGRVRVPAPATEHILRGLDFGYGPVDGELATPTGAALAKALVGEQVPESVAIESMKTGCGTGTRSFGGAFSVLRVISIRD